MAIGYPSPSPTCLPINTPPIVSETSKTWERATGLSTPGVPLARGVGHKAISRWPLASGTVASPSVRGVCGRALCPEVRQWKAVEWDLIQKGQGVGEEGWAWGPKQAKRAHGLRAFPEITVTVADTNERRILAGREAGGGPRPRPAPSACLPPAGFLLTRTLPKSLILWDTFPILTRAHY